MIALITGGNRGIGYETARLLLDRNVTVVIGARDADRGSAAAARLGARSVRLDVTDPASAASAADWVAREYGRLDILVNNAGVGVWDQAPADTTPDTMRTVYETNVFGPVFVTNAMLPLLRKASAARLVFVSSGLASIGLALAGDEGFLNNLSYNSSKTALNAVAVSYARDLADTSIKVNIADPGYCATDMTGHASPRSAAEGAAVIVQLALLDKDGPTGTFISEDGPHPW
ncbi:SDR family oxidoreductase [Rhizohabitans arisaemae]|uniref:SDR family oxidoreductase n=1 Tax=Rhizohabitans arisaemae TaxID=2720610 RepID=UPI0024B120B1|nr:SDR family oxidoreductase [Rhizohabitans arisaemae]